MTARSSRKEVAFNDACRFVIKFGRKVHGYGPNARRLEAYLSRRTTALGYEGTFRATPTELYLAFTEHGLAFGLDYIALGLNWGRPAPDTYGSGLPDQYTADAWFRIQVTKVLAVSPMIQVLVNPALNPDDDVIAVFGLRVRFSF